MKTDIKRKQQAKELLRVLKYLNDKNKYPSVPDVELIGLAKNTSFKDTSANELTKSLISYITYNGGFATRQQSQGQYNSKLGKWTRSTTKKGVTDITGVLNAKPVNIEVKYGKDTQSEEQKEVEQQITRAGGDYYIAKNLPDSIDWINKTYSISPDHIARLLETYQIRFKAKK